MSPSSLWGVTQLCLLPFPEDDTLMCIHIPRMFLIPLWGAHPSVHSPPACAPPLVPTVGCPPAGPPSLCIPRGLPYPSLLPSVGCPHSVPISLSPRGVQRAEGPRRKSHPQVAEGTEGCRVPRARPGTQEGSLWRGAPIPESRSPGLAAATGRDLTVPQRDIAEIPLNKQQIIDGPISQPEGGDKSRGLAPRGG